jgi:dienelactone hydrolase
MTRSLLIACVGSVLRTLTVFAADPPAPVPLTAEVREELVQEIADLRGAIKGLQTENPDVRQLVDAEIGIEAVDRSLRFEELTKKNSAAQARAILAVSKMRIEALKTGQPTWGQTPGRTLLGYRSRVDGTAQPYALTLPEGYTEKGSNRLPLYIELHGRGEQSEVPFFSQHEGKPAPADQTYLKLDVFGRGNNAYRFAGESDVFEALNDVIRRYRIDERRIVLWGFSMGGAGSWHIGLHYPAKWCSVGPGAGFVDFYKYQKVEQELPSFQDRTLRIYDTTNYAMNLANVPLVTYGGEVDPQLAASTTMRDLAKTLNVPVKIIIGPKMGHKFDDASKAAFMAFHAVNAKRGLPDSTDRRKVRFTTCTVKYNECDWLRIEEQTIPYEESIVESEMEGDDTLHLDTENVNALSVSRTIADKLSIDDSLDFLLTEAASGRLPEVYFVKENDAWQMLDYDDSIAFAEPTEPRKRHNLQGPIDDAFSQPFLCVRGTGTPWSNSHQAYADWNLTRFQKEFDQWMRGQARTIDDTAVTDEQIADNNLVLFGDPGSNAVLARVIENLPFDWTEEAVTFNDTSYNPDLHSVALIFPNPLNRNKYVVLNTGHSFHEKDFKASNAQLYPRLGDAAVLRFRVDKKAGFSEEIVTGEIFNTQWELEE